MKKALVLLADGFEEIEAVSVMDILRRAGVEVSSAFVNAETVMGAHGIKLKADISLSEAARNEYDALILPGGGPGSETLASNDEVLKLVRLYHGKGKLTAAICAAPMVFARAGVADGHTVTSFPGFEHLFADYKTDPVVVSGNLVTSRGPGTAVPFALKLTEILEGNSVCEKIKEDIIF
jgi:4-methyl-5(b-hydroxyethyl)-thiazole monophosphate biosynthesis